MSPDRSYTSTFEFNLRDFNVTDEIDDSIFEPGECVHISSLQVENANTNRHEMPTPMFTRIPATMKDCAYLESI